MLTLKIISKPDNLGEYSPEFLQDKVLINNYDYKLIFGEKSKGITEDKKSVL